MSILITMSVVLSGHHNPFKGEKEIGITITKDIADIPGKELIVVPESLVAMVGDEGKTILEKDGFNGIDHEKVVKMALELAEEARATMVKKDEDKAKRKAQAEKLKEERASEEGERKAKKEAKLAEKREKVKAKNEARVAKINAKAKADAEAREAKKKEKQAPKPAPAENPAAKQATGKAAKNDPAVTDHKSKITGKVMEGEPAFPESLKKIAKASEGRIVLAHIGDKKK